MSEELKPCPFCKTESIYQIDREDEFIRRYPQLFCNACKIKFEVENDSPYINDNLTYDYLLDKLYKAWNRR